ncbi:sporulation protein YqfD [Bhargavaea ginsengi]|uniref:sporulation protein YqfD n=1 Tax=Bhargavaea ginsengi TaxID=426757 RepID=UPI002041F8DD|nr:sporulation protein YqfD [Bhargavaea ginsengi]MCM3089127.1 sporulation protein YqfD [Bhargavaea ginsengi]
MRTAERLRGKETVRVTVSGSGAEAFFSACAASGIRIRDAEAEGDRLQFSVFRKDMPAIRRLRLKYRVRLRLSAGRTGIILDRSPLSVAAVLLFLLVPLACSGLIWSVGVEGGKPERQERISDYLEKSGIRPFIPIGSVPDEARIRNDLMVADPGLSWVRVSREGGRLTVHPIEAPETGEKGEGDLQPAHLAASKRAVITRFELTKGVRNVLPNTTVEKGDIVASGIITQREDSHVTGAEGKVYGDYYVETRFEMPAVIRYSAPGETAYQLAIGGKSANADVWREIPMPSFIRPFLTLSESRSGMAREIRLTEENGEPIILSVLKEKMLSTLDPDATVKDEKVLRVHYDNDKVKGTILFLINENIAVRKHISQGD